MSTKEQTKPGVKTGKKKKGKLGTIFLILLVIAGICLALYPYVSQWLFDHRAESLTSAYEQMIDQTAQSEIDAFMQAAEEYNRKLLEGEVVLTDPFEEHYGEELRQKYEDVIALTDDGVIGVVKIPCINVNLPIYFGTGDDALTSGIGHLEGTSLPIGGESSHCVVCGHTGLNNAKIFTDLHEMEEGDTFFIYVMGEELVYEVDRILVIEPEDTEPLRIIKGEDHVTLLTCTPFGSNTHRLLVRGVRIYPDEEEITVLKTTESKESGLWMEEYTKAIYIGLGIAIPLVVLLIILDKISRWRKKKKKKDAELKRRERELMDSFRFLDDDYSRRAGGAKNAPGYDVMDDRDRNGGRRH